jgi:hypothetical protein
MTVAARDETLDLRAVGACNPVDGWRAVNARAYVPFDARPAPDLRGSFHARIARRWLGDVALVDSACGPATGRREIPATAGDDVGVALMRRGRDVLGSGRNRAALEPGQAFAWDSGRDTQIMAEEVIPHFRE